MWYGIMWSDANRNMIRTHKQRKPQKPNEWAYDLTEWNAQRRRIAAAAAITISLLTDIRKCYNNDWVSQMHTQAHRDRDADGADQTNAFKKNRFTRKRCSVEISCGYVKNHTKFTSTQTKKFYIDFVISIAFNDIFSNRRGSKDNHRSFELSYLLLMFL